MNVDWSERAIEYRFIINAKQGIIFKIEARIPSVEAPRAQWLWSVTQGGSILNRETLMFDYDPSPSERTEEFKRATRFASREEAYEAMQKYLAKYPSGFALGYPTV